MVEKDFCWVRDEAERNETTAVCEEIWRLNKSLGRIMFYFDDVN